MANLCMLFSTTQSRSQSPRSSWSAPTNERLWLQPFSSALCLVEEDNSLTGSKYPVPNLFDNKNSSAHSLEPFEEIRTELAEPIQMMAKKQYWIEEREKDLRQQVLKELKHHQDLQRAWALGPLQLYRRQGILEISAY